MKALLQTLCAGWLLAHAVLVQAETKLTSRTIDANFNVSVFPKDGQFIVGQYHQWVIQVTDNNDRAVDNARMSIAGGMEAHGHGLPSKPQISSYLGDGKYLIEGMLFNMAGRWALLFVIQTPQIMDRVRFDFDVEF